ncbi:hypothetical protein BC834DRAFT_375615 [Gloeopeniophorella convolvens]|nr:hypothetical protein BC834DRAFT_375615 [Gloeopeniophorella convolvens]
MASSSPLLPLPQVRPRPAPPPPPPLLLSLPPPLALRERSRSDFKRLVDLLSQPHPPPKQDAASVGVSARPRGLQHSEGSHSTPPRTILHRPSHSIENSRSLYRTRPPSQKSAYEQTRAAYDAPLSLPLRSRSPDRIHEWANHTPPLSLSPSTSPPSSLPSFPERNTTPPLRRRPPPPTAARAPRAVRVMYRSVSCDAKGTGPRNIGERELELNRKERELVQREAEVKEREEAAEQRKQEAEDLMADAMHREAWVCGMLQALAEAQAQARDAGARMLHPLVLDGEGSDEPDVELGEQSADDETPSDGLRGSIADTMRSMWYTVRTVKSYKERTNRGPPNKKTMPKDIIPEA